MPEQKPDLRLAALRRFAGAITVLNLLGHTVFGFEQSWAQPFVAVGTAYATEILLELIFAWSHHRRPRFLGGPMSPMTMVDFLLSAHISGLAISMLLYANDRLMPLVFAAAVAIASKHIVRVRIGNASRHFFNPSNIGITFTLLCFPWVGIAQPYMFTENLVGPGKWLLPGLIVLSGTFLNYRFTKKLPLIAAWLGAFVLQAAARCLVFGTPLLPKLLPMTGMAFVLFTFYMVSDPATTPVRRRNQVLYGASVAAVYGLLVTAHVVFDLFFSLSLVCLARGIGLYLLAAVRQRSARSAAGAELPARTAAAAVEGSGA
ncbi:MAG TPA: RnfABCDGE type electron transport complex subunit D [Thermoanaerobaculia bacterium]|nr:RnfABCDGE type electron transport complex subunit D [Thermoanaerobaculia bacterium]